MYACSGLSQELSRNRVFKQWKNDRYWEFLIRFSRKDAEFFWVVSASKFLSCNLQFNLFLWRSFDCITHLSCVPPRSTPFSVLALWWLPKKPTLLPTSTAFLPLFLHHERKISVWFPVNLQNWFLMPENTSRNTYLCCVCTTYTCMWHSWSPLGKYQRTWFLWDFSKPSLHRWSVCSFTYMWLCSAFACRLGHVSKDGPGKKRMGKA